MDHGIILINYVPVILDTVGTIARKMPERPVVIMGRGPVRPVTVILDTVETIALFKILVEIMDIGLVTGPADTVPVIRDMVAAIVQ